MKRSTERAARALTAIDPEHVHPDQRDTFTAATRVLAADLEALDRSRTALAARRTRTTPRGGYKRTTRKPDPPELTAAKVIVHDRSGGICEAGLPGCEGRAVHVHHRAGRGFPGAHHPDLLLDVCRACHDHAHGHPEEARRLGVMVLRDGPEARSYRGTWPPQVAS